MNLQQGGMVPYTYGVLITRVSPKAERHNKKLLGSRTLGIEVTSPIYVARCGIGNLDPQHAEGKSISAAEEALHYPIPPAGTILVTERIDKDSLATMAILELRFEGLETKIDKVLVSMIGALDTYGMNEAFKRVPELFGTHSDRLSIDALNSIARSPAFPSINEKVSLTKQILCGEMSREMMQSIVQSKVPTKRMKYEPEEYGGITYILAPGCYDHARQWSSSMFPVTLIDDPFRILPNGGVKTHHRMTLVMQSDAEFDCERFKEEANKAEARKRHISQEEQTKRNLLWGGPPRIASSPLNTKLTKTEVLQIAHSCLKSEMSKV